MLYSLRCGASSYYEQVKYCADKLEKIGTKLGIFPFTLSEYEISLKSVETEYKKDSHSPRLIESNPWLFQEFRSQPHKYVNDISVCRILHSFAKDSAISDENFPKIEEELKKINVSLEPTFQKFTEEERQKIWEKLRSAILSKTSDFDDYWMTAEKLSTHKEHIIQHDVYLLENSKLLYDQKGDDQLGPKILLITIDKKLLKCRKDYPFVISTEQFLEFMMPYLFLADIPAEDPNRFPNQILAAQLGINLSYWKPKSDDYVLMILKNPGYLQKDGIAQEATIIAKTLSRSRLESIIQQSENLSGAEKERSAIEIGGIADELIKRETEKEFYEQKINALNKELEKVINKKKEAERRTGKLQRTLRYYKGIRTQGSK